MEFRWEQHTRRALKEAEALLSPVSMAWMDASLPSLEVLDPSTAIERLLDSILKAPASADVAPAEAYPAPPPSQVSPANAIYLPPRARTSPTALRTFAHPSLGPHSTEFGAASPSTVGQAATPLTPPGSRDDVGEPQEGPSKKADWPLHKPILDSPRLGVTRMVTELPDLQNLFGALVSRPSPSEDSHHQTPLEHAHSSSVKSAVPQPESPVVTPLESSIAAPEQAPLPRTSNSGSSPAMPLPQQVGQANRLHGPSFRRTESQGDADRSPDTRAVERADFPSVSIPDAPRHSLVGSIPSFPHTSAQPSRPTAAMEDPTWEERLFDRFMDLWEDRLREQAIRHTGFTGGLT